MLVGGLWQRGNSRYGGGGCGYVTSCESTIAYYVPNSVCRFGIKAKVKITVSIFNRD